MTKRFTLYGSPHSLPTYKVALMLHLAGEPFSFRYVSFQKGMHKTPEFLALSRWGQVPVLIDGERVYLQSAAIVEHLAETLGRFNGADPATRQATREWLYWDVDVLFPPIFSCYGVRLGQRKLLPIDVEPAIADYHRQRARAGALCAGCPACRSQLSLRRGTDHCRSLLLWRCRLCRALRFRPAAVEKRRRLDREIDGAQGIQGALRIARHGGRRILIDGSSIAGECAGEAASLTIAPWT
jgi:hypothetical protein